MGFFYRLVIYALGTAIALVYGVVVRVIYRVALYLLLIGVLLVILEPGFFCGRFAVRSGKRTGYV